MLHVSRLRAHILQLVYNLPLLFQTVYQNSYFLDLVSCMVRPDGCDMHVLPGVDPLGLHAPRTSANQQKNTHSL